MESQGSGERSHDRRLLIFVLVSLFTANVAQWAVCRALHLGSPGSIAPDLRAFFHVRQWTDSWLPMMKSLDYFKAHPTLPIYDAKLYDTLIYSLASELPLVAMRKLGMSDGGDAAHVGGVILPGGLGCGGGVAGDGAMAAAAAWRGVDVDVRNRCGVGDAGVLSADQGIFAGAMRRRFCRLDLRCYCCCGRRAKNVGPGQWRRFSRR